MEAVGSEVGQKMRSAIKAKLMELGCYVDDELPDYVMVMVANKRTRHQMEEDLQLFLTSNTHAFVNWLHQVLQKLQEVTINTSLVKSKSKLSNSSKKLRKDKEKKKDKDRLKVKDPSKVKLKKSKKEKSDDETKNRPKSSKSTKLNIPPLLMNLEKESSPSITDVFAGQILKSHGIVTNLPLSLTVEEDEKKPIKTERLPLNRKRFPVIDPESVPSIDKSVLNNKNLSYSSEKSNELNTNSTTSSIQPDIRAEDEDIIDIRIGQRELNDFNDDSMITDGLRPKISQNSSTVKTSCNLTAQIPAKLRKTITGPDSPPRSSSHERSSAKRSVRDRLGNKVTLHSSVNSVDSKSSSTSHSHRKDGLENQRQFHDKGAKIQNTKISKHKNEWRKNGRNEDNERDNRKIRSRIIPIQTEPYNDNEYRNNITISSVIRAPPKPKPKGAVAAPNLLLRAVAETHKSLLSKPPKIEREIPVSKKTVTTNTFNPTNILIQVPSYEVPSIQRRDSVSDVELDIDTESLGDLEEEILHENKNGSEYVPEPIDKQIIAANTVNYVPTHILSPKSDDYNERPSSPNILLILNSKRPKIETDPQFVVTLDGVNANLFLEKKIINECDSEDLEELRQRSLRTMHDAEKNRKRISKDQEVKKLSVSPDSNEPQRENPQKLETKTTTTKTDNIQNENLESSAISETSSHSNTAEIESSNRKRKSPIIFNRKEISTQKKIVKDDNEKNKYDSLPTLPRGKKRLLSLIINTKDTLCKFYPDCKLGASCEFYHPSTPTTTTILPSMICTTFPACPYRDKCAYTHPSCKYGAGCVKRDCPYNHSEKSKSILSLNNTPASVYKSSGTSSLTSICKFYPNCTNINCHFYHPKPCRFGKFCLNKSECNFYHYDSTLSKWKTSFQI